jgi:anti-sigma factor RsiW
MNSHPETEKLNAYYDKELLPAEAGQVREHLESCQACREILLDWEKVQRVFLKTPGINPSAGFVFRVMEGIQPKQAFNLRDFVRWLVPTGALMLGAVVLISVVPFNAADTFVIENEILKGNAPFSVQENTVSQTDVSGDWMGLEAL